MPMNDLKEVYVDQLQDIYSANVQAVKATKKLQDAAADQGLKDALGAGVTGFQDGADKIKTLIEGHDADPNGEHCRGMEGLVREAQAHALDEDFGNGETRDAMIITQYQRMVHYALAAYGCVNAFARRLDADDDATVIAQLLDDTYEADRNMTHLATGGINKAAA